MAEPTPRLGHDPDRLSVYRLSRYRRTRILIHKGLEARMAPLSGSAASSGFAVIGRRLVRHAILAAILALVVGCAGSEQHAPPEAKPAAQATDRCVEHRGDPTKYAQCLLLVGPDRYEFIPEIGRTADLDTQLRCHFARFDLDAYTHCLGLEPRTANPEQQWPRPIAPTSAAFGEPEPALGADSTYIANLVVCLSAEQPGECRYDMLASSHLAQVRRAEYRANLARCILSEEPCDWDRLTLADRERVDEVWARAAALPSSPTEIESGRTGLSSPPDEARQPNLDFDQLAIIEPQTDAAARIPKPELSDTSIRQELIRRSIASYPGSCPCPYNVDRGGRRCGGRSAYSRLGGYSPMCYESDVSQAMVERFRQREQRASSE